MKKNLIWEAVKEPLREIVMAAIPGVLAYLQTISATWATILYLIIRAIDQYLHEKSKTVKNPAITGLTF